MSSAHGAGLMLLPFVTAAHGERAGRDGDADALRGARRRTRPVG